MNFFQIWKGISVQNFTQIPFPNPKLWIKILIYNVALHRGLQVQIAYCSNISSKVEVENFKFGTKLCHINVKSLHLSD